MDRFLPGYSKMPLWLRRVLGASLGVVSVIAVTVPMLVMIDVGPACGGGYPRQWCEHPLDSVVDNWGMYNRECVSYTAFRVYSSGRNVPLGLGDANNWPLQAKAQGVAVDGNPKVGDVAIRYGDDHGHSMYVESINNNGTINISQYNAHKTGTFSQATITTAGLVFIHF